MLRLCEGFSTDFADEGLLASVDDIMSLKFICRWERFWTNRAMMHFQITTVETFFSPIRDALTIPRAIGQSMTLKLEANTEELQSVQLTTDNRE